MGENNHKLLEEAHVLFHPLRYKIVELLRKGPMYINEIAKAVGKDRRLTSYHLRTLEEYGFVSSEYEVSQEGMSKGKALRMYWLTGKVDEVMVMVKKL